ncbi:hypothetical protein DUW12_08335 [Salmonella enterica subsp. enterica serovar Duisburg]|nr:hypothetical protein [Salmonella enterica]EBV2534784.1 hypothetical protein [Salmonella enterica subsp. enterica serovar Agbeni]EBW2264169.1 hypothetical protein [Salmonella enterica subsp. enterica serovar Hillingdon]EBW4304613.1 hypothetical protein [Salmonella enterica subsp. enterica serovar Duisburg]ECC9474883.1 hypothetical protein [Salmonella enterica subsp. enterica]
MKEFFAKYDKLLVTTLEQNIYIKCDDNFNVWLYGSKKQREMLATTAHCGHAEATKKHFERWLKLAKKEDRFSAISVHVAKTTLKEINKKKVLTNKSKGNYKTMLIGGMRTSRMENMKVTSNIKEAPTTSAGSIALDGKWQK